MVRLSFMAFCLVLLSGFAQCKYSQKQLTAFRGMMKKFDEDFTHHQKNFLSNITKMPVFDEEKKKKKKKKVFSLDRILRQESRKLEKRANKLKRSLIKKHFYDSEKQKKKVINVPYRERHSKIAKEEGIQINSEEKNQFP